MTAAVAVFFCHFVSRQLTRLGSDAWMRSLYKACKKILNDDNDDHDDDNDYDDDADDDEDDDDDVVFNHNLSLF